MAGRKVPGGPGFDTLETAAGGLLCAGVAAVRVTLATFECSLASGGDDGAVSALPCGMRQRSKTLPSRGPFYCLRKPWLVGQLGYLLTWWFGLPKCTQRRPNLYPSGIPAPCLACGLVGPSPYT